MIFFSLYFPILISLSLSSFLIHAFKKHIHSFFGFNTTTTNYNKLHKKFHNPISSTATATAIVLPRPPIGLIDKMDGEIGRMMTCTESLGFESFEIGNDDGDDNFICNKSEEEEDDWRRKRMGEVAEKTEEGAVFPPPLSSLDGNGQPSFVLLPVRNNGRLQLSKVRVKRPEILCATREDGRLRLYLVPDDDVERNDDVEEAEVEEEEETEVVEEEVVEMISRYYGEEEEEEEDRVREWEFPATRGNEWFRRCHQVVHHIQCHHHVHSTHNHLQMYGVGIA